VVSAAVRHGLNQHRAVVGQCNPAGLFGGTVHGTCIATIHSDSWDAIGWTPAGNAITCNSSSRGRSSDGGGSSRSDVATSSPLPIVKSDECTVQRVRSISQLGTTMYMG
jgi:hypothetical protein